MNRRQKKKLYKKLCDKHNVPYSSFLRNRELKTMTKGETKKVSQKLCLFKDIIKLYSAIGGYNKTSGKIVENIDRDSLYPVHMHQLIMTPSDRFNNIIKIAKEEQVCS